LRRVRSAILEKVLFCEKMEGGHFEHMLWKYNRYDASVLLRNMTSICLLNLIFRKNRSKNVIEYSSRQKSILKKPNAPKMELYLDSILEGFYYQGWCGSPRYLICQKFSRILFIEKYNTTAWLFYKNYIYKVLFIKLFIELYILLNSTAFIVFYKNNILHLIFFLRDRYVPHNKKLRKKNFVFNLLRMRKESCIKIKTRKNKSRLRKELNILIKHA